MTSRKNTTDPRLHSSAGTYRLLVLHGGASRTVVLPSQGEVRIGRSSECEVRVEDDRLAPIHAVLVISPELAIRVLFDDDGAENVASVGNRLVRSGETIRVSPGAVMIVAGVTLVVQVSRTSTRLRLVRSHDYFEARIEDECARAEATNGEFTVVKIRCTTEAVSKLEQSFGQVLRPMDVVALYAPNEYEMLLIDTPPDAAELVCRQLVSQLEASEFEIAVRSFPESRTPELLAPSLSPRSEPVPPGTPVMSEMDRLKPIIELVATSSISVLLLGETGVGKEVAANAIHYQSARANHPLVTVNCGAFSETLLDSELFGHERGSFTGSTGMKVGLIESADGGTLFLDEAGEMPPSLQTKLLRVLEQRQVMRIGSVRPRTIDVRFIAATNRDLETEVARGTFRSDLYYRLAGTTIVIPPLRERRGEIAQLAEHFIEKWCAREGSRRRPRLTGEALRWLQRYSWPGNIRELKNTIERAVLLCRDGAINVEHLPIEKLSRPISPMAASIPAPAVSSPLGRAHARVLSDIVQRKAPAGGRSSHPPPVDEPAPLDSRFPVADEDDSPLGSLPDERARVLNALERCAWNQTQAAKYLGMSRRTLIKRLELFALPRPRKAPPS